MSLSPLDLIGTGKQIPLANRSQNLQRRIEHGDAGFETHLVIALARASVSDILCTELMRSIHKMLRDQRTGKRRHQRVLVLVHGVSRKRLRKVFLRKHLAHIHYDALEGTDAQSLFLDLLKAIVLLPHIANYGDDVEVHFVLQPLYAARCIKTTGICKYYFVFLLCHDNRPFRLRFVLQ